MNVLSLFSGCGGMDIGFEGGFTCLKKSINEELCPDWIKTDSGDFVTVTDTAFNTIFANDIRPDAKVAWASYFINKYPDAYDIYHLDSVVNLVKMQMIRKQRGMKQVPVSLHLVFSGNPGTGKTTVARILGRIYKEIGLLSKGHLVEVDRSGLVAGYVGQTALKTQEVINSALGGILFIDEAYTLVKEGNDYGQEAIDTILKAMEDNREDFIVIVAGYSDLMEGFVNSNPGLKSRFNKYFYFPDYSEDELTEIFMSMCKEYGYVLTKDAMDVLGKIAERMVMNKTDNFANARDIRNLFENVITAQSTRLANEIDMDMDIGLILFEDLEQFL